MAGALFGRTPSFVIDRGRGDVPVSKEILYFADIDGGIQEQGGGRGPEGVGRVHAGAELGSIRLLVLFDGARQPHKVTLDQQVHADRIHGPVGEFPGPRVELGPE